jgi:mRNA-degrading endonuclease toxin of MazEF toxin-antitoxin module
MKCVPKQVLVPTRSFQSRPAASWSAVSGDLPGGYLVGGPAGPDRFRAGLPKARGRGSRGCVQPKSNRRTVVCVPLTSSVKWADAPGNVMLSARLTGLPKNSVANVSQVVTLDKGLLTERAGRLPPAQLRLVLSGIDVMLGR